MRLRTYWWGCLFIPENQREVDMLNMIPQPEESYENGEAKWVTNHEEFDGSLNPKTEVIFPLGKALEISR